MSRNVIFSKRMYAVRVGVRVYVCVWFSTYQTTVTHKRLRYRVKIWYINEAVAFLHWGKYMVGTQSYFQLYFIFPWRDKYLSWLYRLRKRQYCIQYFGDHANYLRMFLSAIYQVKIFWIWIWILKNWWIASSLYHRWFHKFCCMIVALILTSFF